MTTAKQFTANGFDLCCMGKDNDNYTFVLTNDERIVVMKSLRILAALESGELVKTMPCGCVSQRCSQNKFYHGFNSCLEHLKKIGDENHV